MLSISKKSSAIAITAASLPLSSFALDTSFVPTPPAALVSSNQIGSVGQSNQFDSAGLSPTSAGILENGGDTNAASLAVAHAKIAEMRKLLGPMWGLHKPQVHAALDRADWAVGAQDISGVKNALDLYQQAFDKFMLSRTGMVALAAAIPTLLFGVAGIMQPERLRQRVDTLMHRPTGIDFQEREFLQQRMAAAKGPIEVLKASRDVLAYLNASLDSPADVFAIGKRLQNAATLSGVGLSIAAFGIGLGSGSFATALASGTCVLATSFIALTNLTAVFDKQRASVVGQEYKIWRAAQEP